MRTQIEADLKGLKMMWIRGWKLHVLWAWLEAWDHYPNREWWAERPWR